MAEAQPVENAAQIQEDPSSVAKHDATGAADIEKITDFVEEAEISAQSIGDVRNCSFFNYRPILDHVSTETGELADTTFRRHR